MWNEKFKWIFWPEDRPRFKFSGVHQFISSSVQSSFLNTDTDTDNDTDTDTEIILKLFERINLIDYLTGRNTEGEQKPYGDENKWQQKKDEKHVTSKKVGYLL